MRLRLALPLLLILTACSRPSPIFSLENARAHVNMLAGTIGSRPIGTPANARARQYVIDQLRLFVAPLVLGAGRPAIEGADVARIADGERALSIEWERSGEDMLASALLREW